MLVCLPTAQNSVEANEGVKISTCKEPKENALFGTQRNCEKELGETANLYSSVRFRSPPPILSITYRQ